MNDLTKNRRKKILINRSLQLRMAFNVVFFIVIYLVAFILMILIPQMLGFWTGVTIQTVFDLLVFHSYFLWVPLLIIVVLLVVHMIYFSHRIAGPLFRLQKHLETMKGGDLSTELILRKKDFLKDDLEVTINQFAQKLRSDLSRLENIKASQEVLRELADDLQKEGKTDKAVFLSGLAQEVEQTLSRFKVK